MKSPDVSLKEMDGYSPGSLISLFLAVFKLSLCLHFKKRRRKGRGRREGRKGKKFFERVWLAKDVGETDSNFGYFYICQWLQTLIFSSAQYFVPYDFLQKWKEVAWNKEKYVILKNGKF